MTTDDAWLDAFDVLLRTSAPDRSLLELGCGEGRDTRRLSGYGGEVVAVDRRLEALRACRAVAPNARLVCLDLAEPLPFPDRCFALVVASLSLHYFDGETTRAVIREIARVLRRGGALLLRVNSTRDVHHGATGHPEVEPGLHLVHGRRKRFFDREAVTALAAPDWNLLSLEERGIDRYDRPKHVWQALLSARARPAPSFAVAPASPEDGGAIALVHVLSWQYAYRHLLPDAFLQSLSVDRRARWWTRAVLDDAPRVLLARDGERIVGFVAFGASRDDDAAAGTAEIHAIYVSPLHWGLGVGPALLSAALAELRAVGYDRTTLWIIEGNGRAQRFYERHGFGEDGVPAKTFELGGTPVRERRLSLALDRHLAAPDTGALRR